MSKEAMKLALEALEVATTPFARDRQEVLRAQAALREALAQQALDKKAENARELGLDYEPAQQCKWPTCQSEEYQQALAEQIKRELVGEQPAQQEFVSGVVIREGLPTLLRDRDIKPTDERLYTSPPAQQEPVGRLESDPDEGHVFVPRIDGDWSMLGEDLYTSPPAQRTWVSLTDEEVDRALDAAKVPELPGGYESVELEIARAIEAKLKEKNNV